MQNKVTQTLNLDMCRFFQMLHFKVYFKKGKEWGEIWCFCFGLVFFCFGVGFFWLSFFFKLNTILSCLHFFSLFLQFFKISLNFQPLFLCLIMHCNFQHEVVLLILNQFIHFIKENEKQTFDCKEMWKFVWSIMCNIHNFQLTPFSSNSCLFTLSSTLADKAAEHTTTSANLKGTVLIFLESPLKSN